MDRLKPEEMTAAQMVAASEERMANYLRKLGAFEYWWAPLVREATRALDPATSAVERKHLAELVCKLVIMANENIPASQK